MPLSWNKIRHNAFLAEQMLQLQVYSRATASTDPGASYPVSLNTMTAISKEFTRKVIATIQQEVTALGFKRRKTGIFSIQVGVDVLGTVGLNTATRSGSRAVELNLVIGVRDQRVERLVAELSDEPFDEVIPPTLAGNIGYISPINRYLPFLFTDSTEIPITASALGNELKAHGLPFIHRNSDLKTLVETMQTARFGLPFVTEYRIPVGLLLLGQYAQATAYLSAKLEEIGLREDSAAIRYRRFASHALKRMNL